jgi:hypothetical protein
MNQTRLSLRQAQGNGQRKQWVRLPRSSQVYATPLVDVKPFEAQDKLVGRVA